MKIGDEVYVHGYVDEIRNDVVIIRNDGGYFGTVPSEVNCSEKPNDCETCGTPKHLCQYCIAEDRMWTPKTKPQEWWLTENSLDDFRSGFIHGYAQAKHEYESENEPQMWTCPKCGETHHIDFEKCPCCGYEPKTEPQTETHDLRTDTHGCVKMTDCAWMK